MFISARSLLRCQPTLLSPSSAVLPAIADDDGLEEWEHPPGRDPRTMTVAELTAMGHPPISRAEAIRKNCVECCCGNAAEVRRCHMTGCPMWPFRMGTDPYRAKQSEAQRAHSAARGRALAARRAGRQGASKQPRGSAEPNKP
jgi:hypothetical protein